MIRSDKFKFEIDESSDIVSVTLHGKLNAKCMINCITTISQENRFKDKSDTVFDMEDAEFNESFGDLLQMIDFTNLIGSVRNSSRWAFVANSSNNSEFLDKFITLTGQNRIQIRRFTADEEAQQWLNPTTEANVIQANQKPDLKL